MIYLYSGTPGSGKSYDAAELICKKYKQGKNILKRDIRRVKAVYSALITVNLNIRSGLLVFPITSTTVTSPGVYRKNNPTCS